ncbi:10196_t:CDS:10, partial [Scutellospora calospora]
MIEILLENVTLIVGLILVLVYWQLPRRAKLNEPPLAYYRFPIIGHTWRYLTDCEGLILESRQKYGETFSIYIFGQLMTVVGKETSHEVLKKDKDFDFNEGTKFQLPLDYIFPHMSTTNNKTVEVVKDFAKGKLKDMLSRLQQNLTKAMDIYIGECIEPKVIHNIESVLSNIVSIPIANIVVGEECYHFGDILETFRQLTNSIAKISFVPPILAFIHPWLHQQFVTFGWNPIAKHRNIIINRIRPVIEKRLKEKKELGDAWVAPLDALQVYLNDPAVAPDLDPNHVNYVLIADSIGLIVFAAMSTTSHSASYVLYNLAGREEYWQELYEEAQEINKQCNENELTSDDIAKMVKLDSFVKESLRLAINIISLSHKCISKSHYTFENGYQIPSGRIAILNYVDTINDEGLQGHNPSEFYAYRHLERNSSATKVERSFLTFGGGKHACPGRFLAVNEIKMIVHKIILKYHIRTESGKVMPYRYAGANLMKDMKD